MKTEFYKKVFIEGKEENLPKEGIYFCHEKDSGATIYLINLSIVSKSGMESIDWYLLPVSSTMAELVKAYEEYVELIGRSESSLAIFAQIHGSGVSEELVKQGKKLRQKITELRNKIGI